MKSKFILLVFVFGSLIQLGIGQSERVYEITADDNPFMISYEAVFDTLGFYWVGTNQGVFRYNTYKNFEKPYESNIKLNNAYGLSKDAVGNIWVINDIGELFKMENGTPNLISVPFKNPIKILTYQIRKEAIILYTDLEIYELNIHDHKVELLASFVNNSDLTIPIFNEGKLIGDKIYLISENLQASYLNGVDTINLSTNVKTIITENIKQNNNYKANIIQSYSDEYIFIQTEGPYSIWYLDTKDQSIHLVNYNDSRFELPVSSINKLEDKVFALNTLEGSYRLHAKSNSTEIIEETIGYAVSNIQYHNNQLWFTTFQSGIYLSNQGRIKFLAEGRFQNLYANNEMLLASKQSKVHFFKNNDFRKELTVSKKFNTYGIIESKNHYEISVGNEGVVYINKSNLTIAESGLRKGLKYFNLNGSLYSLAFGGFAKDFKAIVRKRYYNYAISPDEKYVYLSHQNGVDKLNVDLNEVGAFIEGYPCRSLTFDKSGRLWISSRSTNILSCYENDKLLKAYDKSNLFANACYKILLDEEYLWLATDNGLLRLHTDNESLDVYSKLDGLQYSDIYDVCQNDEFIYMASSKGLYYLPKIDLEEKVYEGPNCYIQSVKVWDENQDFNSTINLKHNENNLFIKFVNNDYRILGAHKYYYRMLGIDSSWISTPGNSNFARYPQLSPGEYTFEVYSSVDNNRLKSKLASLDIKVQAALINKWWFRGLLALALLYLILKSYGQYQKNRLKNLEDKLESEKMKSLIQQMNPHFIYNTLNSIQYFIFKDKKFEAGTYLANFSDLMRKNFEFSALEFISLREEVHHIKNYLKMEKIRFEDDVAIAVYVDESIDLDNIKLPPFMLQPILENAFKHGFSSKKDKCLIKIDFIKENNYLKVTIEDNGVGRKTGSINTLANAKRYSSLDNIKKRIQLLNALDQYKECPNEFAIINLSDTSENSQGVRVSFKFGIVK